MYYLVFRWFLKSLLPFSYWFHCIMIRESTLCNFSFFKTWWSLLYGPGCTLSWLGFCGHLKRMYFLLLLSGLFCWYKWQLDPIIGGGDVEFLHTLACFLPSSISWEGDVEISNYYNTFIYFSLQFYQDYYLRTNISFCRIDPFIFIPDNFPCSEVSSI